MTKDYRLIAEANIHKMMSLEIPYEKKILGCSFKIDNHQAYPPGSLAEFVGEYIRDSKITDGKVFADCSMGSFSFGIFAAKYNAKHVIGSDCSEYALASARQNLEINNIDFSKVTLYRGDSVHALIPEYLGKIDVLLCGIPWDSMSKSEFDNLDEKKKPLFKAFFDIDDCVIKGLLSNGFKLLSRGGRMIITSAESHFDRIKKLTGEYEVSYNILHMKDLHDDGNMHYLVELTK